MTSQSDALRLLLAAIAAMREAGYTQQDLQELAADAWDHIEAGGHQPYAFGRCTDSGRLIIGWSAYQWTMLVRKPCPNCGEPW